VEGLGQGREGVAGKTARAGLSLLINFLTTTPYYLSVSFDHHDSLEFLTFLQFKISNTITSI
jgi:hypothetical protein